MLREIVHFENGELIYAEIGEFLEKDDSIQVETDSTDQPLMPVTLKIELIQMDSVELLEFRAISLVVGSTKIEFSLCVDEPTSITGTSGESSVITDAAVILLPV